MMSPSTTGISEHTSTSVASYGLCSAQEISTRPAIRHLAAILDGNRRWAAASGLSAVDGYQQGAAKVKEFLDWCSNLDIPLITLWPLSIENLQRDPEELSGLLDVIRTTIEELAEAKRWKLKIIGNLRMLPGAMQTAIDVAEQKTKNVEGSTVNIAVAYSGREEIISAFRSLLIEHAAGGGELSELSRTLSEEHIASRIYTAGQPNPDLVIRTSGEQRISGFMPWQTTYSEFYFSPAFWPDFTFHDFTDAIESYLARSRRFGA